jgi:competence protein ComEA
MTEDKVVAPAQATSATAQSEIININTASSSELDKLPGVGPVIAQRIVDYRSSHGPFTAIDQIQDVKGIGPATFGKMQSQISVE